MTDSASNAIRILPGQWRPQCPAEQIAWVGPPWPTPDHLWLDFPEAVFVGDDLLYLSHVSERFPSVFSGLPKVPWESVAGGIRFSRTLPNGLTFGGSVTRLDGPAVALELTFANGGAETLRDVKLQTCAYLRAIRELADFTHRNVFVHCGDGGWQTLATAALQPATAGWTRVGWRCGPAVADWPVIACESRDGGRGVAMTWFDSTYSLIGNPNHPCIHADPFVGDLAAGGEATVRGALVFFEKPLAELEYERDIGVYDAAQA